MTKRGLISVMSSVFDPCGYLSPFVIRAKLLAQELWKRGIGWDQQLPVEIVKQWQSWLDELDGLAVFQLPRHHPKYSPTDSKGEIHVFSDAPELAFAAVAYLRYRTEDDEIVCTFLASKWRIAPLKILSIPRLELQGALLAARLGKTLEDELKLDIKKRVHWTDSEIVLKYLQNGAKRFKPFVANRIAEILELTDEAEWHHVASDANPADCCTRGLPATSLTPDSTWYQGPSFLRGSEDKWPDVETVAVDLDPDDNEVKRTATLSASIHNISVDGAGSTDNTTKLELALQYDLASLLKPETYSTLKPLLRRTAWIQRALHNFASVIPRLGHKACREVDITAQEYEDALIHWARVAQREVYGPELESLRKKQPLKSKSSLYSLMPFFDEDSKCLRVGGRLRKAPGPRESNFQLILPTTHHVTRLIADDVHQRLWHCGQEHLIAEMRKQFWPVKAREVAKAAAKRCFFCYLQKAKPRIPKMDDLPACRLDITSGAFSRCGVDYWGPMLVKIRRGTVKRWGCLFTCLTTRGVHLELADSLESDDFLLCVACIPGKTWPSPGNVQ